MKTKACLCALLVGLFYLGVAFPVFAFNPCTDAAHYEPVEKRYTLGLLFKIEMCGKPASYLFGTMHLDKPEIDAVAAGAFTALKNVQAAGFELAESIDEIKRYTRKTILSAHSSQTLREALGSVYYWRLIADMEVMALKKGVTISPARLNRMKPWLVALLFTNMDEDFKGLLLDEKLWIAATLADKPIFGLESMEEQMEVFGSLPDALQVRMLKEEIGRFPEFLNIKPAMIAAYAAKDIRKLMAVDDKAEAAGTDREIDGILRDRMLTRRNRIMERRLLPHLRAQSVLVSVGVLHLMGKDGILALLERDGYFITPMP